MSGTVGLDQKMRILSEAKKNLAALVTRDIERDAPLVTIVRPPVERPIRIRLVLEKRTNLSRRRAARRLKLDHIGAEVAEDLPAQQSALVGEIEYAIRRKHHRCIALMAWNRPIARGEKSERRGAQKAATPNRMISAWESAP